MSSWFEDEYRRRMKKMGYEPTMDGMDDQDVKDALEAMDRRNSRQQEEWQYPRYKPVDPGLQARILRMFGQPYDPKYIREEEKYYLNGWDNGDDDDDPPQAKPAPNLFAPSQGRERQPDKPWTLNWGKNGNMFGAKPPTPGYRPEGNGTMFPSRGVMERLFKYGPGGNGAVTGYQLMSASTDGRETGKNIPVEPKLQAPGPRQNPPDTRLQDEFWQRQKTPRSMMPSAKVIDLIGQIEGFSDVPYKVHEYDPLTIGYGHVIQPGEDFSRGITKEEARTLKLKDMKVKVDEVNEWAKMHNVKLTQQQFDALVSFHYNTGLIFEMEKLRDLIKSGTATPDEIKVAFGEYYKSRGKRLFGLWKRRMDEADMFLNGEYEQKKREMPKDIEFDNI